MPKSCRSWLAVPFLAALLAGCESFSDLGNTISGWTGNFGQTFASINPLGAEAIAIGRATPVLAGNTFVSGGDHGVRVNYSYEFRLAGHREGTIDGEPAESWLFVDRRLENNETFLQLHRVEGGTLEDFGAGESFFIDRVEVTAQLFCIGRATAEVPPAVRDYMDFIAAEGFPEPKEYLLRRFTERRDRDNLGHRVDMVYVEDVLRHGYTCEEIGNLVLPTSEAIKVFLDAYKLRSQRAFAITG